MDGSLPVTVLMPVFNAGRHLRRAVDSVLGQTFSDFELLVVNDGSTDRSRDILASYGDPRMRVIDTANCGVAAALQLGLEQARGTYVARMDADDECVPQRLEVQKAYLDGHPDAILVHSRVDMIDDDGRVLIARMGDMRTPSGTRWRLVWHNVPFHPTVMFRASVFRANGLGYRLEANLAEDFDLWNRAVLVGEFHMLPEVLVRYRVHSESVTRGDRAERQLEVQGRVIRDNFARYGIGLEEGISREIAVISGSTRLDAESQPYVALRGRLLPLLRELDGRFRKRFGTGPAVLRAEQAMQLAQWARHMLRTSRMQALVLLWAALRRQPALAFRARSWATLAGCVLPRTWIERITAIARRGRTLDLDPNHMR